ncbi:hypothetical protein CGCFRS4_v015647 [Colletotrichum fructicola]|nr:hypothetical protein CGCFRS4_v015647 [Colletotrichum fructicola]
MALRSLLLLTVSDRPQTSIPSDATATASATTAVPTTTAPGPTRSSSTNDTPATFDTALYSDKIAAIAGFHASVHNKWVMLEFHLVSSQDHLFVSDYGAGWVAHQKPRGSVPETMTDAYWRAAGIVPPANMAESPTREPQE